MTIAFVLWIILQLLVGYNLVFPWIIYLIALSAKKSKGTTAFPEQERDFAVIVTAYEQTDLLPDVVHSLLEMDYKNFTVYIVADNCDISQLQFNSEHVHLLSPETVLRSNVASHLYAIDHFIRPHTFLTIIDSDNLVHPAYLRELNRFFAKGYQAVQGMRAAKNLNTVFARLDSARDIYYHFYDGEKLFEAGSSATLTGSAMAFSTALYLQCLKGRVISGAGFDKVLQFEIVKRNVQIAYAPNAIVYDEKTAYTQQLVNQRSRWINTWFRYFGFGFSLMKDGIRSINRNKFLFGLVLLRPPLFMFGLLAVFLMVINWWISPVLAIVWVTGLCAFAGAFLFALINPGTDRRIYQSLFNIPVFIFYQLVALFKIRKAEKMSVATRHFIRQPDENKLSDHQPVSK